MWADFYKLKVGEEFFFRSIKYIKIEPEEIKYESYYFWNAKEVIKGTKAFFERFERVRCKLFLK